MAQRSRKPIGPRKVLSHIRYYRKCRLCPGITVNRGGVCGRCLRSPLGPVILQLRKAAREV